MTAKLDYGIFDCDTHCYETRDAFTRYLPKEVSRSSDHPGARRGRHRGDPRGPPGRHLQQRSGVWVFDLAYRPGSLKEMLKQMGSGNPDESPTSRSRCNRNSSNGSARLEVMAEQNVERAGHLSQRHGACRRALRRRHRGALCQPALVQPMVRRDVGLQLPGQDLRHGADVVARLWSRAIAETEAIIEQGAKFVLLPTGPAYGRSPGDPYFDPIYARLQEAGCTLVFHISRSGTSTPSRRPGDTIPIPPPGTCRRGSG